MKNKLGVLLKDLKDQSSHSVDYLLSGKVEETLSAKGIKIRKLFTPLFRFIFGFETKYKLKVDKRFKLSNSGKGRIYIVNHRQGDDIVLTSKAIKDSGYFVFGNRYLSLDTIDGFGLWGHGMILLDRDNRDNRKATYEKMRYVLNHQGNIIIYPEGYWNLADNGQKDTRHHADDHHSESWLIQDFNIGAFRLAQELGCEIVPVVLHYDEIKKKMCYAQIGEAITIDKSDDVFVKKDEILVKMRTMYYELMEKYSNYRRSELEKDGVSLKEQWELLKEELLRVWDIERTGYKLDLEDEKRIGKAKVVKEIITNEDAFSHLEDIAYNQRNAYLLCKKLTGRNCQKGK